MPLVTRYHADRRGTVEALLRDIPTSLCQDRASGGRKAGHMCHLATCHQREAGMGGKPQDFLQPCPRYFFDDGCGWPTQMVPAVLVPGGSKPIGSQSG